MTEHPPIGYRRALGAAVCNTVSSRSPIPWRRDGYRHGQLGEASAAVCRVRHALVAAQAGALRSPCGRQGRRRPPGRHRIAPACHRQRRRTLHRPPTGSCGSPRRSECGQSGVGLSDDAAGSSSRATPGRPRCSALGVQPRDASGRLGLDHPGQGRAGDDKQWSDSGSRRQERQLKHRAAGESRRVPVPPELSALLQTHLAEYGTTTDGRLFRGERGGLLPSVRTRGCGSGPGWRR